MTLRALEEAPGGVKSNLSNGMSLLEQINARLRQESGMANHEAFSTDAANRALMEYLGNKGSAKAAIEAFSKVVNEAIKSGKLTAAEVSALEGYVSTTQVYVDAMGLLGDNGGVSGISGGTVNLKPQALMDELAESGVKYNPDDVIMVTKTPDGKLMWLESGDSSAGLKHIVDGHTVDFANRGINDIPSFLYRTLHEMPVTTGITKAGPFAKYIIDGKMYKVGYGSNGYIVSFYPTK